MIAQPLQQLVAVARALQTRLRQRRTHLESDVFHEPVHGVAGVFEEYNVVCGVSYRYLADLPGSRLGHQSVEVGLDLRAEGIFFDGLVQTLLLQLPLFELVLLEVPESLDLLKLLLVYLVDLGLVLSGFVRPQTGRRGEGRQGAGPGRA